MDSGVLADLAEQAVAQDGIDSVTVVRNGYVVLDAVIYPFPEETAHNGYSCTKSVTGTLIGIAIDQGLLAGVDVPVVELLPDAAPDEVDEQKAAMTVEDLLTMSSGLRCQDSYPCALADSDEIQVESGHSVVVFMDLVGDEVLQYDRSCSCLEHGFREHSLDDANRNR